VDVTFASSPGTPSHRAFPLGKGPTLGYGPNIHPDLHMAFKDLADKLEIPYKVEVMPLHSGTEAYAIQVAAEGIPTMVLFIPIRYMHTPVEIVSLKDINRVGRLIAEYAASLDESSLEALFMKD
jgi:endoglucanase